MISAYDFVTIDEQHSELELPRLKSLYAELGRQPPEVKKRLTEEFLNIIENSGEHLKKRIFACNVLGGKCHDLQLSHSKDIVRRLQRLVEKEFVLSNEMNLGGKKPPTLMEITIVKYTFLKMLLIALLRIDFNDSFQFTKKIAGLIKNGELKKNMLDSLSHEASRLEHGQ